MLLSTAVKVLLGLCRQMGSSVFPKYWNVLHEEVVLCCVMDVEHCYQQMLTMARVTDQARIAGLALMDLSPVNVGFQTVLKQVLSGTASIRPSATAFQGATYFQAR